jgi:hypothetical protein
VEMVAWDQAAGLPTSNANKAKNVVTKTTRFTRIPYPLKVDRCAVHVAEDWGQSVKAQRCAEIRAGVRIAIELPRLYEFKNPVTKDFRDIRKPIL